MSRGAAPRFLWFHEVQRGEVRDLDHWGGTVPFTTVLVAMNLDAFCKYASISLSNVNIIKGKHSDEGEDLGVGRGEGARGPGDIRKGEGTTLQKERVRDN